MIKMLGLIDSNKIIINLNIYIKIKITITILDSEIVTELLSIIRIAKEKSTIRV